MIILVCGLPGVGKTTVANELAPLIDATVLSSDKIRKEIISEPNYTLQERRMIYEVLLLIAKYLHKSKVNCILDATFNKESSRKEVKEKLGLPEDEISIVECICPENIVVTRLEARRDAYSDAGVEVYRKMKKIYEPVKGKHITVNTTEPVKVLAKKISQYILKKNGNL